MDSLDDEIRALAEARGFTARPWEFHPAEVHDGVCPYAHGGAVQHWAEAVALRAELVREIEAARAKPKRR